MKQAIINTFLSIESFLENKMIEDNKSNRFIFKFLQFFRTLLRLTFAFRVQIFYTKIFNKKDFTFQYKPNNRTLYLGQACSTLPLNFINSKYLRVYKEIDKETILNLELSTNSENKLFNSMLEKYNINIENSGLENIVNSGIGFSIYKVVYQEGKEKEIMKVIIKKCNQVINYALVDNSEDFILDFMPDFLENLKEIFLKFSYEMEYWELINKSNAIQITWHDIVYPVNV